MRPKRRKLSRLSRRRQALKAVLAMIVVGLTPRHLGPLTPRLSALAREGGMAALDTVTPAVTCSVQASFMTGLSPRDHGVVANGWLFRDQMEIFLWRQSNRLVGGEKIWEAGKKRDPAFTCANMFWWYNMASSHDFGATPRPIYKADGRKLPDCYTVPGQLRDQLTERFGPFPLFQFWGPGTSIVSTRWIADASKFVMAEANPTLTLAYLPHLDYDLQRFGPDRNSSEGPAIADRNRHRRGRPRRRGACQRALSHHSVGIRDHPRQSAHPHQQGASRCRPVVRARRGRRRVARSISSRAFAVADHQIAHIYLSDVGLQAESEGSFEGTGWRRTGLRRNRQIPYPSRSSDDPVNSSRSPTLSRGSLTIIGTTMTVRRTLPARSKFTASPDTIQSSFSSIPASRHRSSLLASVCSCASWDSAP